MRKNGFLLLEALVALLVLTLFLASFAKICSNTLLMQLQGRERLRVLMVAINAIERGGAEERSIVPANSLSLPPVRLRIVREGGICLVGPP